MCRMEFMVALARAMGRPPTDEERTAFLAAMAEQSGGEYLYVPKLRQSQPVDEKLIHDMHAEGSSIRKIARKAGCSKSHVHNVLSKFSPYAMDTQPV